MTIHRRRSVAVTVAIVLLTCFGATVGSQAGPTPHPLGAVVATSSQSFGSVSQLVVLPDGNVLIADGTRRLLTSLDATLATQSVLLDSAAGKGKTFSTSSFLMPFRGDSALFYDRESTAFLVVSPSGGVSRVMAQPITGGRFPGMWVVAIDYGVPTSSPRFGMVFKTAAASVALPRPAPGEPNIVVRRSDSIYVVAMNYETRRVDTLSKLSAGFMSEWTVRAGRGADYLGAPPAFAFFDDAVATTDGSIALLHAQEYRLEWIHADGRRVLGPKMSYPWRPITDDRRQALADSINAAQQLAYTTELAKWTADSTRNGGIPTIQSINVLTNTPISRPAFRPTPRPAIRADLLPDFYPPTLRFPLRADGDNHVWIRHAPPDGARDVDTIWDIVDHESRVIDRVIIPIGQSVVGFAPGGFVFVTVSDAGTVKVEKRRVR